jgi:hypothetical protein
MNVIWREPGEGSPGAGALHSLLSSLSSEATEDELALGRQAATRAAHAARANRERSRHKMIGKLLGAKVVLTGVTGGMVLTGGVAAAATGALPPSAQHVAHQVFSSLGIRVPSGQSGQRYTQGRQDSTKATTATTKGSQVSDLARSTTATGVNKGAVISTYASGGKSQAGQQGKASTTTTGAPPSRSATVPGPSHQAGHPGPTSHPGPTGH